jgi:hypothetical protein
LAISTAAEMNEGWSSVTEAERPVLIAPVLDSFHINAIDHEVNSTNAWCGVEVLAVRCATHGFIDRSWPVATRDDDALAGELLTHTL